MKLFLISQTSNDGYDTYDEAVVCAETEEDAKTIHPDGYSIVTEEDEEKYSSSTWTTLNNVDVEYLGEAKEDSERGVICSSFNAG